LDGDNPDTAATAKQQQYQAWFVRNIVANGKLFVVSRIDPLFWVLSAGAAKEIICFGSGCPAKKRQQNA
jgi:hypothetical protein